MSRSAFRSAPGFWLLDLTLDGHTYRYAVRPVEVPTAVGGTLDYAEGLMELQASLYRTDEVSITLDGGLDWGELWANGRVLDGQPVVLRRAGVGQSIEEARVVIRGRTTAATFGFVGAPGRLAFKIERREASLSQTIPRTYDVVSPAIWTTADPQVLGAAIPYPIGRPGYYRGSIYPAYPCLVVSSLGAGTAMIAAREVAASSVRVFNTSQSGVTTSDISITQIPGQPWSFCDLLPDFALGQRYFVGFPADGEGTIDGEGRSVRGAGDLIRWMVAEFCGELGFDFADFERSRDALNQYQIDTFINGPANAWGWLRSNVFPLLPIDEREGQNGKTLRIRKLSASRQEAEGEITEGAGWERLGPIRPVREVVNDFEIRYAPERGGTRYLGVLRLTGETDVGDEFNAIEVQSSRVCQVSRERYGHRSARVITTRALWDPSTAARVLQDQAIQRALQWVSLTYVTSQEAEWLREDTVLTLNDGPLVDRLAIVRDVTVGGADVRVMVDLVPEELERL